MPRKDRLKKEKGRQNGIINKQHVPLAGFFVRYVSKS